MHFNYSFQELRFKISYKISRLFRKYIEIIFHKYTRVKLFQESLSVAEFKTTGSLKNIKYLLDKGNYISGFIPFINNQTSAIVYNYFSTCYGLRSNGYLLKILVDKKFKLCSSIIIDFNFRESLVIDVDKDFKHLPNYEKGAYFIVLQINERIPKNHGTNNWVKRGGSFRFWGTWNNNASVNHSFFIPHPSKFLTILNNFDQGKYLERMVYPKEANKVLYRAPFLKEVVIDKRGDVSGQKRLELGYSLCLDNKDRVRTINHSTAPFSRVIRQKDNFKDINHIVIIPPGEGIDTEMFFGECCSKKSSFKASLYKYTSNEIYKEVDIKTIEIQDLNKSLTVKEIFKDFESSKFGSWITFEPLSGKHDKNYINHIYKSKNNKLFDAVHSHNFIKYQKYRRTLKFCPIKILAKKDFKESLETFIVIIGDASKEVEIRIRIFDLENRNFEIVNHIKMLPYEIKFLSMNKYLAESNLINRKMEIEKNGICQIECDTANLNSNFYFIKKINGDIDSIAVDHLTGG